MPRSSSELLSVVQSAPTVKGRTPADDELTPLLAITTSRSTRSSRLSIRRSPKVSSAPCGSRYPSSRAVIGRKRSLRLLTTGGRTASPPSHFPSPEVSSQPSSE